MATASRRWSTLRKAGSSRISRRAISLAPGAQRRRTGTGHPVWRASDRRGARRTVFPPGCRSRGGRPGRSRPATGASSEPCLGSQCGRRCRLLRVDREESVRAPGVPGCAWRWPGDAGHRAAGRSHAPREIRPVSQGLSASRPARVVNACPTGVCGRVQDCDGTVQPVSGRGGYSDTLYRPANMNGLTLRAGREGRQAPPPFSAGGGIS